MEPESREFETHCPQASATAYAWERGVLPRGLWRPPVPTPGFGFYPTLRGRAGMLGSRISKVRPR